LTACQTQQEQIGPACLIDPSCGKSLYQNGANCTINGRRFTRFTGAKRDCAPCDQRNKYLRTPDKTRVRQVACYRGVPTPARKATPTG
jgi:hypothetical protein